MYSNTKLIQNCFARAFKLNLYKFAVESDWTYNTISELVFEETMFCLQILTQSELADKNDCCYKLAEQ